ncbi:MAG: hypothetical protein ABH881_02295 [bacterium]
MTKYLTVDDLRKLSEIVKGEIISKSPSFYGWVNPPELDGNKNLTHTSGYGDEEKTAKISVQDALDIYKGKLDGSYGERFVLAVCVAIAAVRNGHKAALLQITEEEGVPFDASGWIVMSFDGHPIFHISPDDLPMAKVEEAGLITVVVKGSLEAKEHGYKGTNKVSELSMFMDMMFA